MKALSNLIERAWYGDIARYWPVVFLLWPLSLLFCSIASVRKFFLMRQQEKCLEKKLSVPLIVIGNISVGGTGKTPLLCALAEALMRRELRVGIISRGYGGSHNSAPCEVLLNDDSRCVGDEPLLLARATGCPVVIGRDRLAAAKFLLSRHAVDVVLSDDGLQHYALPRDIEIAVLDGQRGVGNAFCLPAGPLREPVSRLDAVDFVVLNGTLQAPQCNKLSANLNRVELQLSPQCWVNVKTSAVLPLDAFQKEATVHAVAGIGNPARFFSTLKQMRFTVLEHAFSDHHGFSMEDFMFGDDFPVLMTEKDAVKCTPFARESWYALRVAMPLPDAWVDAVWQAAQKKHKKVM